MLSVVDQEVRVGEIDFECAHVFEAWDRFERHPAAVRRGDGGEEVSLALIELDVFRDIRNTLRVQLPLLSVLRLQFRVGEGQNFRDNREWHLGRVIRSATYRTAHSRK